MPGVQQEEESELINESFNEFRPDYEALYRLSISPDFQALVAVMKAKAKSARRKLDDARTNDWQAVGFNRGFIWIIKYIYREVFIKAKEVVEETKKSGGK